MLLWLSQCCKSSVFYSGRSDEQVIYIPAMRRNCFLASVQLVLVFHLYKQEVSLSQNN